MDDVPRSYIFHGKWCRAGPAAFARSERAAVAGVGFLRGAYPAFVAKGPGFQIYRKAGKLQKLGGLGRLMVCAMPKQPNGTPGKKPPAPSVKKGPPAMPLS